MDLNTYTSLPDYLTIKEIQSYFNELLEYVKTNNNPNALLISEALNELAMRQWHTYELLDETIKNRIETWVISNWDIDNFHLIDNLTSIIGLLGLNKGFLVAKASLNNTFLKIDVRNLISDFVEELDGNINDPYSGMK